MQERNVFLMVVFSVLTLGIHPFGWLLKNISIFNALPTKHPKSEDEPLIDRVLAPHPQKVSKGLAVFALLCFTSAIALRILRLYVSGTAEEYGPFFYVDTAQQILSFAWAISFLALAFRCRDILGKYFKDVNKVDIELSKVWTFLFTVYYLQLRINKFIHLKDKENPTT